MRSILIAMLLVLFTTGCSSQAKVVSLEGEIQNNIISANSTVAGKLVEMGKQQGEPVKKGEVIAVIDNTNQKYLVDQLQAVVELKKAKLEELQAGTRPQQIEQARAQVRAAEGQLNGVAVAQEALDTAKLSYDYVQTQYQKTLALYQEGAMPQNELDSAKYKLDSAAKQVATAKAQLNTAKQLAGTAQANYEAAKAQLKLLESGATKQTLAAAQADLDQAVAQLNQAKHTLKNCTIVAPADGVIISKNYELGDVVNVGSNIADIAGKADIYVLAYIPDEYLDRISYNQPLKVTTSLGTQTGRVSYIALKHEYTPKDERSTSDSHMATKLKVAINSQNGKLKSGMEAKIEIPLP